MKTLAELTAIKERMQSKVNIRENIGSIRIVVGMATCGIAAGARPVLNTLVEGIYNANLTAKASVTQTGCLGNCQYEPIVEVYEGDSKVTYVNMTSEKAAKVVEEHIKNGKVVTEYTIDAATK